MDDSYDYPPGRGHLRLLPILIGLVLIGVTMARGCQQGPFGRRQVVSMGPQQEAALGEQSYQQVLSQSQVLHDEPVVKVVEKLAKELIQASKDPEFVQYTGLKPQNFQWECRVVRSKEVNAFCLPGGKIVVYTGILPVARTESALAAVMGHEIGHVLAHHGAERMVQQQMVQIAEGAAAGAMSDMDPQRQRELLGVMGVGGKLGVLLPFSRKHESEADRIGLLLIATSGRDPHAAIDFWKRMAKMNHGGQPPAFLSTHPSNERRIADLESLLNEAMPFYETAPEKIPDRPLPLDMSVRPAPDTDTADHQASSSERDTTAAGSSDAIPTRVQQVLRFIDQYGRPPQGYEGGRTFLNLGRDGEQTLPTTDAPGSQIRYREWDVNRHVPGVNRGAQRLITGSDGSAYYTSNHYRTFRRIR